MSWVLWDIFLPIVLAFAAGLFFGWLMWRWRRQPVDVDTLRAARREAGISRGIKHAGPPPESVRSQYHPRGSSEGYSAPRNGPDASIERELAEARKRIDVLNAELSDSRKRINSLHVSKSRTDPAGQANPGPDNYETPDSGADSNRLRDLEARLRGANRKIADLENTNRHATSGELRTKLIKPRMSNGVDRQSIDGGGHRDDELRDLQECVQVRDELIKTLQQSLDQFGNDQDSTALAAEVALRDRKIDALETMLDQSRGLNS